MKKLITIIILLAFTTSINAQWFKRVKGNGNMITKTRSVGEYDKIVAGGSFDVKLIAGTEGKITIHIDENLLEYLITEVENDRLKLKWKKGSNISTRNKILITVPFKDISGVTLSGSGDVFSEATIKASDFKAILSGSGNMKLAVKSTYLSSRISGSGNIRLSGAADKLEYAISGSGNINGYELVSNEADVRISGSGGIKTNVTENLKARIAGSGNIYYKGNPKRQDTKVSGSGNVSSR